jgi:hypothetical protein
MLNFGGYHFGSPRTPKIKEQPWVEVKNDNDKSPSKDHSGHQSALATINSLMSPSTPKPSKKIEASRTPSLYNRDTPSIQNNTRRSQIDSSSATLNWTPSKFTNLVEKNKESVLAIGSTPSGSNKKEQVDNDSMIVDNNAQVDTPFKPSNKRKELPSATPVANNAASSKRRRAAAVPVLLCQVNKKTLQFNSLFDTVREFKNISELPKSEHEELYVEAVLEQLAYYGSQLESLKSFFLPHGREALLACAKDDAGNQEIRAACVALIHQYDSLKNFRARTNSFKAPLESTPVQPSKAQEVVIVIEPEKDENGKRHTNPNPDAKDEGPSTKKQKKSKEDDVSADRVTDLEEENDIVDPTAYNRHNALNFQSPFKPANSYPAIIFKTPVGTAADSRAKATPSPSAYADKNETESASTTRPFPIKKYNTKLLPPDPNYNFDKAGVKDSLEPFMIPPTVHETKPVLSKIPEMTTSINFGSISSATTFTTSTTTPTSTSEVAKPASADAPKPTFGETSSTSASIASTSTTNTSAGSSSTTLPSISTPVFSFGQTPTSMSTTLPTAVTFGTSTSTTTPTVTFGSSTTSASSSNTITVSTTSTTATTSPAVTFGSSSTTTESKGSATTQQSTETAKTSFVFGAEPSKLAGLPSLSTPITFGNNNSEATKPSATSSIFPSFGNDSAKPASTTPSTNSLFPSFDKKDSTKPSDPILPSFGASGPIADPFGFLSGDKKKATPAPVSTSPFNFTGTQPSTQSNTASSTNPPFQFGGANNTSLSSSTFGSNKPSNDDGMETISQPSSSIFGNTNAPSSGQSGNTPNGSIFGFPSSTPSANSTPSFGNNTSNSSNNASIFGGFGSNSTNNAQPPSQFSTSIFGSNSSNSSNTASVFGVNTSNNTSSVFGNNTSNNNNNQNKPASGNVSFAFGNSTSSQSNNNNNSNSNNFSANFGNNNNNNNNNSNNNGGFPSSFPSSNNNNGSNNSNFSVNFGNNNNNGGNNNGGNNAFSSFAQNNNSSTGGGADMFGITQKSTQTTSSSTGGDRKNFKAKRLGGQTKK